MTLKPPMDELLTFSGLDGRVDNLELEVGYSGSDVVDLRDWDGVRPWTTSLGYTMTIGSPLMTCLAEPFTSADIGKIVIAKQSGGSVNPLYMATILDVSASGVAQMSSNAPATLPAGQRGQRGFDMEVAINAALMEVAGSNYPTRRVHLPGFYRASQVVLPMGIDLDGSFWGTGHPSPGGIGELGQAVRAGTWLQQIPGAQKDLLILEKYLDGGVGANFAGNANISNLVLIGPEQSVIGTTWTLGSGFAAVAPDGDPLKVIDGFYMGTRGPVYALGFPQDGFHFPDGGLPLFINNLRPFFNGRYGLNIECRTNPGSSGGNNPSMNIMNVSGDGNSAGMIRFTNSANWSSIVITNAKSEKADYWPTAGSPGSPSAPTAGMLQESSIIFEDCDNTPVVINGSTHISAAPAGSHTDAPGPHIKIISATDKRPQIVANGIGTRRIPADELTNLTNGVDLRDSVVGVDVPAGTKNFVWPPTKTTVGSDLLITGEEVFQRGLSSTVATGTLTSGNLRGALFTCKKTQTVATVRVAVGTAAGATPTLVRVGIYTVGSTGTLTLVASSANDTAKLGAAASAAGREDFTLSTPYKTLAGRRLAVAIIVVTGAAAPSISAGNSTSGLEMSTDPRLSFGYAGQADLTTPITEATLAGAANTALRPYFVLLP